MSEIWAWQFDGKMLTNTEVPGEKIPAAISFLSTTNPAWIILGSNPKMSEIWVWQFDGKMLTNTEVPGEKIPAASSSLSTTNPAWIILGSNPSLLDARKCSV